MRNTLLHPFGLALLFASLVLAGLALSVPWRATFRARKSLLGPVRQRQRRWVSLETGRLRRL